MNQRCAKDATEVRPSYPRTILTVVLACDTLGLIWSPLFALFVFFVQGDRQPNRLQLNCLTCNNWGILKTLYPPTTHWSPGSRLCGVCVGVKAKACLSRGYDLEHFPVVISPGFTARVMHTASPRRGLNGETQWGADV
jgi:hypothetical protein